MSMKNRSPWLWIGLFAGLFIIQVWIVPMLIRVVTGADWFKGTREEGGDSHPTSNTATAAAFSHCNRHLATLHPEQRLEFANTPDRSWDIGFGRYMIDASVGSGTAGTVDRQGRYVCRIHYLGGDESDAANWEVVGIEFTNP